MTILRNVLRPIESLLIDRRYKSKKNPFFEFNKLKKNEFPELNKGKVLLGPIRMSGGMHTFEGVMGYALKQRGYDVYALFCGKYLDACETKKLSPLSDLKCNICFAEQKKFCETYEIKPIFIEDFIDSKEKSEIKLSLSKITPDKILLNEKIDLTKHISTGLMRILKNSSVNDEKYLPKLKKFASTSMKTYIATRNAIKMHNFDHVLMSHGIYSTWGGMIKAVKDSKTHVTVWGRGYVGSGNIMATNNDSYLYENIIEPNNLFEKLDLTDIQKSLVLDYFKQKRNPNSGVDYVNYYNSDTGKKLDIFSDLKIDRSKILFGMFPNIPWDGQAFSSSEAFPHIKDFVKTTIEWFNKNKDCHLVIRAHPAEAHTRSQDQTETFKDILFSLYPTLPENVTFLDSDHFISSYQLEEHIRVALLYAGTLGLEFAINKTPVIQLGKNPNSNRGFIFEPKSIEEYNEILTNFKLNKLEFNAEMHNQAIKFGYYWVFQKHIPETIIKLKNNLEFNGFNFNSTEDLKTAETVNWFIDKFINQERFIYNQPIKK